MSQTQTVPSPAALSAVGQLPRPVAEALAAAVADLRYGVVQLTVHDGKVVQLDVTERQRF